MALAVWLGRFVGAMLKECGPELVTILAAAIRLGFSNTQEDSKAAQDLIDRLRNKISG